MDKIQNQPIIPRGGFDTIYFQEKKRIPNEFYKSVILDVLNLISAFFFGKYLFNYLNDKAGLIPVLLFGLFYLIIISFEAVLNKIWQRRILIIFLESILFFYFLFDKNNLTGIFVLWVTFLFFRFWGEINTYNEFNNVLEIKFLKLTRFIFSKTIIAIILIGIGIYLFNFNLNNNFISKDYFENIWGGISLFYQKIYPEIQLNNSVYDFSRSLVSYNLALDKDFKNLLPDEQEKILEESIKKTNENILKLLGETKIDFNQKFSEIIYLSLLKKLNNLYSLYGIYFLISWGVFLFFIWFGIIFVLKIVYNFLLFILFEILRASGFIKITGETRTKEVVSF